MSDIRSPFLTSQSAADDAELIIGVIGDSLALPRPDEGVPLSRTYPYLITKHLRSFGYQAEVARIARAGAQIVDILKAVDNERPYLSSQHNSFCIIHLGIVDCSPRPVPPLIRSAIARLPSLIRHRITRMLHDFRVPLLTHGFSFVNTSPRQFSSEYRRLASTLEEVFERVYAVNIIPPGEWFESRSPGVGNNIIRYNELIETITRGTASVDLIDMWGAANANPSLVSSADGHHLSLAGHDHLATEIFKAEGLPLPDNKSI